MTTAASVSRPALRTWTRSAATTCRRGTAGPSCCSTARTSHYPERLNCAVELLDAVIAERGAERTCIVRPGGDDWTYGRLRGRGRRHRPRPRRRVRRRAGQPGAAARPEHPVAGRLLAGRAEGGRRRRRHHAAAARRRAHRHRRHRARRPRAVRRALRRRPAAADLGAAPDGAVRRGRARRTCCSACRIAARRFTAVDTAADDVALLAFTSGTTGPAEGDDALPPRRARHRRHLRPAHRADAPPTTS